MVNSLRIPIHSLALLLGLFLLGGEGSAVRADPPDTAGGVAASSPSNTHGGFISSLKQAFSQKVDREVVWAHFEVGSAPDTHRFYCLIDPTTGKREPNGVAGELFPRPDGMTGLKRPAVSPVSCADAEQKGILVTSGYTVKISAGSAPGPVSTAPVPAPAAAPAAGAAVAAAARPQGSDLRAEMEAANASGSALASDKGDIVAVLKQWISDEAGTVATCAEDAAVIDDIPPFQWHGSGACSRWQKDNDAYIQKEGITDVTGTLGNPQQLVISGDRAYAVLPTTLAFTQKGKRVTQIATSTFVLNKTAAGWRITAWTWATQTVQ